MQLNKGTLVYYKNGLFYILSGDEITITNSSSNALSLSSYYEGKTPLNKLQEIVKNPSTEEEIKSIRTKYGI